ncbi:hypothetical protein WOLCODRAFT_138673 [Wolfiporia cocos MD-104 SS10]|uniref:Fungal-type protein kinase domain-containing protein n=1 Tax=Wolfiporia cocos (strain MD-104) TaxID=742152 RepID=A0A2H3JQY2_WOLCO|nr:hypothetical protein WOLCODRAFT_138673 [Wolfiporia cocos MD-104 SS10]
MQIPRTPHRTQGSPFANRFVLPCEPTRDFCAAPERLSYGHLIAIFEELRKLLFGDPDYTAGAVSTSTLKEAMTGNLMRMQAAISGTLSGSAQCASPEPAPPPLCQILDTRMIAMLNVAVEGGYSITKPDLMYNTNHDRDSQRWTWSIVPGEVQKKLPGVWKYGADFWIDLDRLQQRYLEHHYIDPEKVGEKRKRDSKHDPELSKSRKRAKYTISCADLEDWEVDVSHIEGTAPEELCHDDAQMLKYINEHMSHNVRSFGSGIMVREMTIKLWYADRMGIIISEPFHIVEQSELLLYAATALGHADLHRLGICHLMRFDVPNGKFETFEGAELVLEGRNVRDAKGEVISERLEFDVTATGEDDIYTEFGIVGRGTTVVPIRAKGYAATLFGDAELVAKIAWPVSRTNRVETTTIMTIRTTLAAKRPTMLDHIVDLKCSLSMTIDELGLPRAYMGTRVLGERVFRTIIMQRYAPLELMNSAAEFKSIFLDVVRAHYWVYKASNILHRDISKNNVMFYRRDGKPYGVLCDWDQAMPVDTEAELKDDQEDEPAAPESSDTKSSSSSKKSQSPTVPAHTVPAPAPEHVLLARKCITEALGPKGAELPAKHEPGTQEPPSAHAQPETTRVARRPEPLGHRTGTGPFMAIDLLTRGPRPLHRYRHDLESFFFLLAYVCAAFDVTRHKFGSIPEWECGDLERISEEKFTFVTNNQVFGDMFHSQTDDGFNRLITEWVSPLSSHLFFEAIIASMRIRNHRMRLEKLDASLAGLNDFRRMAAIYRKKRVVQDNIRKLKAEKNTLVTYEKFMAWCL